MGFLASIKNTIRQAFNSTADIDNKITMSRIMELFSNSHSADLGSDLSEITFFICLKTLSESVGKIPCYLIDADKHRINNHKTARLITAQPNRIMTPSQFFTKNEYCRNYYGNSYSYIKQTPKGEVEGLYLLDPRRVSIWVNSSARFTEQAYYYQYIDDRTGKLFYFQPEEILHFKSWITDDSGLAGKSVREILATSFMGAKASTKFLNELYQNGLTASAVVKYTGDLRRESQDKLLDEIIRQSQDKGRRMITLPIGFDLQTLDLKLTDSQFFELKKFSARQIAAAFGVGTFALNDLEKSSYANAAAQQLQFYTSALLYILTGYEQELNRKLLKQSELEKGLGFKFNVAVILRGDISQQADIIQKMVASGVYSPNDARRFLDQPPIEGDAGNKYLINGSMVPIEQAGAAYKRGDENVDGKK